MPTSTKRLNPDKLINRVLIWRMKRLHPDWSVPQVALQVRQPINVVRHALKLLEVAPKDILQAYEHDSVGAWVSAIPIAAAKGDHRPAKDLLLHSRAIDPVQLQGQTQIAIIFTTGTVPGLQSPSGSDVNQLNADVIDVKLADVRAMCSGPPRGEHKVHHEVNKETPEPEDGKGPQSGSG
jgi:hypothetical protein